MFSMMQFDGYFTESEWKVMIRAEKYWDSNHESQRNQSIEWDYSNYQMELLEGSMLGW